MISVKLLQLGYGGASDPGMEVIALIMHLSWPSPSLGTCIFEHITLHSSTEWSWLCWCSLVSWTGSAVLVCPSSLRLLQCDQGWWWLMAEMLIICCFSWLMVNIYFWLHRNNDDSNLRWMLNVYTILYLSDSFKHLALISPYWGLGEGIEKWITWFF